MPAQARMALLGRSKSKTTEFNMDLLLKDKVILVTGGAKGIGAAIAKTCAAEGARLVIVDRDRWHGEKLQSELSPGGACSFVFADLERENDCSKAVEQAVAIFGRLDALVNNAGVNDKVGLEKGSHRE